MRIRYSDVSFFAVGLMALACIYFGEYNLAMTAFTFGMVMIVNDKVDSLLRVEQAKSMLMRSIVTIAKEEGNKERVDDHE